MSNIGGENGPSPKCFFTSSVLPAFVDHQLPPKKKRPFTTIQGRPYVHTLDVVLPTPAADQLREKVGASTPLQYARVDMSLSQVIEGDFFNHYIKSGNVLMRSQGRSAIDHVFSLSDGVLRLEVDKPTYERLGLTGVAVAGHGRKHVAARYAIDINLRQPSMLRGRRGFERVVWAFKNVLDSNVKWVFHDLRDAIDATKPIWKHEPTIQTVHAAVDSLGEVVMPEFPRDLNCPNYADATELLEWISLVSSACPRVRKDDDLDPYLSRYVVPSAAAGDVHDGAVAAQPLSRLQWHGFIPSCFATKVFLDCLTVAGDHWFSMTANSFDGGVYALLQCSRHTLTWEYEDIAV